MLAARGQVRTVIVVGATGSGKSETIKQLGGRHVETGKPPQTSPGFGPCTREAAFYDIGEVGGARYHFVDTKGLFDRNGSDEDGINYIARLLKNLPTVVGVIYVVRGRMGPSEWQIYNYFFNSLFRDLDPSRLLLLWTEHGSWESYDPRRDKYYLKKCMGIPERILDANIVAVNFHYSYGPSVIKKMTAKILEHAQLWTAPVNDSPRIFTAQQPLVSQKASILGSDTPAGAGNTPCLQSHCAAKHFGKPNGGVHTEQVRTVIVVGITGCGKSLVIKRLGGKHVETGAPPEISAGFGSCTRGAETYDIDFHWIGARYHLVDTMGMLDTKNDDKEGIDSIAHLLDELPTVVGVIYVVAGRMNPPELETCNFLFDTFFHDLPPSRLLVLRTKHTDWQTCNPQVDKDFLRQQNGIPKRILDANFAAVDFHPAYGPDVIREMIERIRKPMQSWTTPVELSIKSDIAVKYCTAQRRLKELEEVEKLLKQEKANLELENDILREKLIEQEQKLTEQQQEWQKGMKELEATHKELIKQLKSNATYQKKLEAKVDAAGWGTAAGTVGGIAGTAAGLAGTTLLGAVAVPAAVVGGGVYVYKRWFSEDKDKKS